MGVTPPAASAATDDELTIQKLLGENQSLLEEIKRLQERNRTLEYRLAQFEHVYGEIAAVVQRHSGAKGVQG